MTTAEILIEAFKKAGQARESESDSLCPSYDALNQVCAKNKQNLLESQAYSFIRYVSSNYKILSLSSLDVKTTDLESFCKVWYAAILFAYIEDTTENSK